MGFFSLHHHVQTGSLTPVIKELEHEANHLSHSSAQVKNAWSYISTSPLHLHDVVFS
jgi:hypothetical protein